MFLYLFANLVTWTFKLSLKPFQKEIYKKGSVSPFGIYSSNCPVNFILLLCSKNISGLAKQRNIETHVSRNPTGIIGSNIAVIIRAPIPTYSASFMPITLKTKKFFFFPTSSHVSVQKGLESSRFVVYRTWNAFKAICYLQQNTYTIEQCVSWWSCKEAWCQMNVPAQFKRFPDSQYTIGRECKQW